MKSFSIERNLLLKGYDRIAGTDEAGRGSLFGPVVAAAVIFHPTLYRSPRPAWIREIADSKLLRPAKREEMAAVVLREADSVGIGTASSAEIDAFNIFYASQLAMRRAVENLAFCPDILLVDGLPLKDVKYGQMGIPQGDRKCASIAAASIVAKVFRDDLMNFFDSHYEGYGLSRHKGYGTEEHYRSLREKGPTGLHRMSFRLR